MNKLYRNFLCIILCLFSLYVELYVNMIIRFYHYTISNVQRSQKPAANANLEFLSGVVAKSRSISFESRIKIANCATKSFQIFSVLSSLCTSSSKLNFLPIASNSNIRCCHAVRAFYLNLLFF